MTNPYDSSLNTQYISGNKYLNMSLHLGLVLEVRSNIVLGAKLSVDRFVTALEEEKLTEDLEENQTEENDGNKDYSDQYP